MPAKDAGWTFGPTDPRTPDDRLKDLRRVQRQVLSAVRALDDAALTQEVMESVQRRHAADEKLVQFGEIPDRHGGSTLAVQTQLLIRTDAYETRTAIFAAQGLSAAPVGTSDGPLRGRVTRLTGPAEALGKAARLASTLRRQGVPISANHVTPCGVQWKSITGPENTSGPAPAFRKRSRRGTPSVRVVVLDTGVWAGKRKDWLKGLEAARGRNLETLYFSGRTLTNIAGHGSFCAGIVQQVAPDVDVIVERVLDVDGLQDEVTVAEHMVTAVEAGLRAGQHVIVSLSLGTETADDERPVAFGVALERIEELQRDTTVNKKHREALVVAAAGNYGHDRPCYPAAFPSVVAVAGLTQGLLPASWSSRGAWVDLSTVGEGVRSTFVPGEESPEFDPEPDTFTEGDWALWTGTSFAAPQVAAAIAQVAEERGLSLDDAQWELLKDRPEIPLYGKVVEVLPPI